MITLILIIIIIIIIIIMMTLESLSILKEKRINMIRKLNERRNKTMRKSLCQL